METKNIFFILLIICSAAKAQTLNQLWTYTNNVSSNDDRARKSVMDSSGLYVVGNDYKLGSNQWRIQKHNKHTGAVIWTQTVNPSSGADYPMDIYLFNSSLYISGYENISSGDYRWRLEKRDPSTGTLQWSKTSNPSSGGDVGFGLCVNDSGVFMVGADYLSGKNAWRTERRDLNTGGLIWYQNTDPNTTGTTAQGYSVAANDTAIFICGYDAAPGNGQWHIEKRRISDGALLWTKTKNGSGSGYDYAKEIIIDTSGFYVVGNDFSLSTTNNQWRIEKRDITTGDTIWTQLSNPSSYNDAATSIDQDADYIYIGGSQAVTSSDGEWRVEKRGKKTGQLFCSQVSNPTSFNADNVDGISVDATGIYVSGDDVIAASNFEWRIEKYSLCVSYPAPVASFTMSNNNICAGEYIDLSDISTQNPNAWNWTITSGNPSSSVKQNPTAIYYNTAGTYDIILTAANGAGTNSTTKSITVGLCTGVDENQKSSLNIFPNPGSDLFTINSEKKGQLNITNIMGEKIYSSLLSDEKTTINLSSYPAGIYFYELNNGSEIIYAGKLIKQ